MLGHRYEYFGLRVETMHRLTQLTPDEGVSAAAGLSQSVVLLGGIQSNP